MGKSIMYQAPQQPQHIVVQKPKRGTCCWVGIGLGVFLGLTVLVFVILGLCYAPPSGAYKTGVYRTDILEGQVQDSSDPDVHSLNQGNAFVRGLRMLFFGRKVTEKVKGKVYLIEGKNMDGSKFKVRRTYLSR